MSTNQPEPFEAPGWADLPGLAAFYSQQRQKPDDLYPSERRFLPWLSKNAVSVLDVGCAAGGFNNIWKHFQDRAIYTGVDISSQLVEVARTLHPDCKFYVGDCASGLPLPDCHSDVVQALGWLHWEPRYQAAIRELWRLTGKYLFFDVRLAERPGEAVTGTQSFSFTGQGGEDHLVAYQVNDWPSFAKILMDLEPRKILGYGYWGAPPESVSGVNDRICYSTFVLEKKPTTRRASDREDDEFPICLDMPLDWPTDLAGDYQALAKTELEMLVPTSTEARKD